MPLIQLFVVKPSPQAHILQGYTLVELMGVLLVLSSMTYMVWSNLSYADRQTNLAALNAFKKEVNEKAHMAYSMCVTDNTCDPLRQQGDSTVEISGHSIYTHYGFPIGWHPQHQADGALSQLLEASHFEIQPSLSNTTRAVFYLNTAHQADHCRLIYQLSANHRANVLTITTDSSGC